MSFEKLIEKIQVIDMLGAGPLDADTDRTFDYINVENYRRGLLILNSGVGTAGDDWNFTVRQADTAAGGNVKDADIVDAYYIKQAATDLTAVAQFTRTTQTRDALIPGNATSAEQVCLVVADLDFAGLDTDNGFTFLGGTLTLDASGGAQYCAVNLILYDSRYPQQIGLGALA